MPLQRRLKNFFKQYSDVMVKVREATSNDPWGPSGSLMMEIAEMSYHADSLSEIMQLLRQRLKDSGKNWRHVYKSLVLLDYLIKNGSKQVILRCHERVFDIQLLKEFKYIDKAGRDQGVYVRQKSRKMIDLLTDEQSLKSEREKAQHVKMQMYLSTLQSMYKLQPTVSNIGSVIEKQQAQHIEKPAIDSPSCTVENIGSIQPVQDLMICEDKAQLLYVSSEDQQAANVPLDLVVSPPVRLKADLKRSGYQTVNLKAKKDKGERKQPISFYIKDCKEYKPETSCERKMVTWADELKKIDYPVSSPLPADFNIPNVRSPVTFPVQDNIPLANVPPTPVASGLMPKKDTMYPWGNEPENLPVTASDYVPAPQGPTSSRLTTNTGFAFKTQIPNMSIRKYPTCASSKLSAIVPDESLNKFIQPIMATDLLSTVQYGPYHKTNPFLSPVIPSSAARGQYTAELAAQSIENPSNVHRPSWLGLSWSGLYPSTSLVNLTPSSIQTSNPQYTGLDRGTASIIPPSISFQRPSPPSVFSVVPRHPTNPFL